MKQKVLVTGAHGFIGSELCRRLNNIYDVFKHTRNEYGNILDIGDFPQLFEGVSYVFHLASTTQIGKGHLSKDAKTNIIGTQRLLQAMVSYCPKAKIIYASTRVVNNGNPTSLYGASKLCAEHYCRIYSETYGIEYHIARLTNVFGIRGAGYDSIRKPLNQMIYALCNGEEVDLYMPSLFKDYIDIDDVVTALLFVAKKGYEPLYEVCTGKMYSIEYILEQVINKINKGSLNRMKAPEFYTQVNTNQLVGIFPTELKKIGWLQEHRSESTLNRLIEKYMKG